MAKAKKLPSGSWRVLLYVGTDENGKKKRKSITADTKKEAELLAAQYLVLLCGYSDTEQLTVQPLS